jgi:drug/metabolite transporter (DMT)-like permease
MSQSNQSVTETQNNHSNLNYLVGISIALLAAMCSSVVTIVLKKLSNQSVHYSITIAYAAYFGLPISLLISILSYLTGLTKKDLSILSDQVEFLSQIGFSLLSALFGTFSQILMNVSLNYEDASKVSLFRSTDVFFAFILQYFFLNIHSNMFSIIGALLILIGTVLILVYKQIDRVLSKKSKADRNRVEKCILLRF